MNRGSQAPLPDGLRRAVEAQRARIRIARLGRIAEAKRQRVLDDIEKCALADMSPFADRPRRRRREDEL